MSNLVKFANAGLPAVQSLSTALRSISTEVEMGVVILKMDRTGTWVYGADQTEVEDDATWAVNPFSFVHGWIAWGDGEVLAEVVAPITQPIPEVDEAPAGAKKGWEKVVGMQLQCTNGADSGLDVRFTTTSVGGKRAVQTLAAEIAAQVDKDPTKPVPIVRLKKSAAAAAPAATETATTAAKATRVAPAATVAPAGPAVAAGSTAAAT